MFFKERSVRMLSLAGHLSTLERHEQNSLNEALSGAQGMDYISEILKDMGFKIGDKKDGKRVLLRIDDTKINNAYLDGDHEMMVVKMEKSFSPSEYFSKKDKENSFENLIEQSKYGPGHLYELFNDLD